MSPDEDVAAIDAQEAALRFERFDEDDAFRLGSVIREEAIRRGTPCAILVRTPNRVLFAATMPGTSADNDEWMRRKANLVLRTHRSSYGFRRRLEARGQSHDEALAADRHLPHADYAAHGGGFPIHVRGSGVVACVVVSGLPQREDHRLAAWGICRFLDLDPTQHDLPG